MVKFVNKIKRLDEIVVHPKRVEVFDSRVEQEDIKDLRSKLAEEGAVVKEAYFGRWPALDSTHSRAPMGLNVTVDFVSYGTASNTYTRLEDMAGLMDALVVDRPEQMVGKRVVAYTVGGQRLVGLAVNDYPVGHKVQ